MWWVRLCQLMTLLYYWFQFSIGYGSGLCQVNQVLHVGYTTLSQMSGECLGGPNRVKSKTTGLIEKKKIEFLNWIRF